MGLFTFWKKEQQPLEPQPSNVRERIKNGAAFLDKTLGPGWSGRVNPETLVISSSSHCVLGQLYGSFSSGIRQLHLPLNRYAPLSPSNLGFDRDRDLEGMLANDDWQELNEGWRAFLAEREHEQASQTKDA